jgi:hypothetical protein
VESDISIWANSDFSIWRLQAEAAQRPLWNISIRVTFFEKYVADQVSRNRDRLMMTPITSQRIS